MGIFPSCCLPEWRCNCNIDITHGKWHQYNSTWEHICRLACFSVRHSACLTMHPGVSYHRDEAVHSISTVNFYRLGYPKTIWRDSNPDFHWMLINPVVFLWAAQVLRLFLIWFCLFPTAHGLHLTDVWIKSLSICQIQTVHFAALLWLILIQTSLRKRMDNYCLQLMFASTAVKLPLWKQ